MVKPDPTCDFENRGGEASISRLVRPEWFRGIPYPTASLASTRAQLNRALDIAFAGWQNDDVSVRKFFPNRDHLQSARAGPPCASRWGVPS